MSLKTQAQALLTPLGGILNVYTIRELRGIVQHSSDGYLDAEFLARIAAVTAAAVALENAIKEASKQ